MKTLIDEKLSGKELYKFLVENKQQLIQQKKSILKHTDAVCSTPSLFGLKDGMATKAAIGEIAADASTIRVKVVANTALWCDSQMDVLLPGCWDKSIRDRKGMIPHIHDHLHLTDAEVGDVVNIYGQEISLTELGLNKVGTTQSLIFETDIKKAYNEKVFNKYKAGKIKQHSIGLQYSKIELAVNDPESEKEYDFWNKYYSQVINPEAVDARGFFWVISEIKLLENSCVLFGSNELTPTLEVKTDTTIQPPVSTEEEPSPASFEIKQLFNIFQNIN